MWASDFYLYLFFDSKASLIKLWKHSTFKVKDRFTNIDIYREDSQSDLAYNWENVYVYESQEWLPLKMSIAELFLWINLRRLPKGNDVSGVASPYGKRVCQLDGEKTARYSFQCVLFFISRSFVYVFFIFSNNLILFLFFSLPS